MQSREQVFLSAEIIREVHHIIQAMNKIFLFWQ
jgi:hypothetical protein